jgi:hypothetical protein
MDANQRLWIVKWADEIHGETFAARLAAAVGYFVRTTFYRPQGIIEGVFKLGRARPYVDNEGGFRDAVFKLISEDMPYLAGENWAWIDNPFLKTEEGRRQLNGLKILMMLTSNWDTKDTRDAGWGVNTAIYRTTGQGRMVQFLYAMDDWGASMGRWGNFFTRDKWDCEGYAVQTPHFVKGVKNGFLVWGYKGKNTKEITQGIPVEDVRWLLQYLNRIEDRHIQAALESSGADRHEVACFGRAIRTRINQLERVTISNRSGSSSRSSTPARVSYTTKGDTR